MTHETVANAAALKVLSSTSMNAAMDELIPRFERASGHHVSISYDAAKLMLGRIRNGETGDLIIHSSAVMDELTKLGKIVPGSRCVLARNGIGVAVLAGAPKPDISTVETFKRALLDAKSIACTGAGASGIYFAALIERFGIAAQVQAKTRMRPGGLIGELVASGEAEIAIQQIPELMAVPGIELVGPLPQDLQVISTTTASVFAGALRPEAAQSLLKFLATAAAARVFRAKGFETPLS